MQDKSAEVVSLVMGVRRLMPRIGTRKLHHLLDEPLTALGVGRDKLFDVLRANQMLIVPKRQYRQTTNSKHMFHKMQYWAIIMKPIMQMLKYHR